MVDIVDRLTRSRMMSGIRGRDTKIEVATRKALHARGLRYRTDVRDLPGRPDIVLPRWRAAILVHGCFWHAHDCGLFRLPATRPEFWRDKLEGNAARDRRNLDALRAGGWRVAVVWECALRGNGRRAPIDVVDLLDEWVRGGDRMIELCGLNGTSAPSTSRSRHQSQPKQTVANPNIAKSTRHKANRALRP